MLCIIIANVILGELINLVFVACSGDEEGGDGSEVEVCLQVIGLGDLRFADGFGLYGHAIERVHDALVTEPVLDQLKVLVAPERKVVDRVREVERVALNHQAHQDVLVRVR